MDFTLSTYKKLIITLINKHFEFTTFNDFLNSNKDSNTVILRHDVDKNPENSLATAESEYKLGIKGTYYFRIIPDTFDKKIIKKIADFGHEIGYHYEDVDLVLKGENSKMIKQNGKVDQEKLIDFAYDSFCKNLEKTKKIYPVKTICAHGSPLAPYDNKLIWKKYDYKNLGITGEPNFDIDWNKFAYLTDTGRRWNGNHVNVRDKVNSKYIFNFKSTLDIINNLNRLPSYLMITVHPQRWNDNIFYWTKELLAQSGKNVVKKYFFVKD